MRAVVITEPGGPDVLQWQQVPDPQPGPDEVVLDVAASAVNRADVLQRQGNYPVPAGASAYPGLECSGSIAALGTDVTGWQVGDEVCALLTGGGYAEQVAVPAGQLMPVPEGISLVDAAALPEVTCTVWSMVFEAGRLQPGESLLIHGGGSGIGTMAVQLAHRYGSRVFVTAGSERKLEFCRALGADVAINYRDQDFVAVVAEQTGGRGVDVLLDNMGAAYLERNMQALATDGRLVVLGMQGGVKGQLDLGALLAKRATVTAAGLRARPAAMKAGIVARTQHAVWPMIEAGDVQPIIDSSFSMSDAAAAHAHLEASDHVGKVLLTVPR